MADDETYAPLPDLDGGDRLRQAIEENLSSGKWVGGMRLPTERALSQDFDIARTRVRRVLEHFVRDGRISRTVGRGTFVARQPGDDAISDEDIEAVSPEELMEVRLLIEPQLADLLVRRASVADVAAIGELVDRGRRSISMVQFEEMDHQFHMALTLAAKNSYLTGIITRIQTVRQSRSWANVRRRGLTVDRQRVYQRQHEEILKALEARDADTLRAAIRTHLSDVRSNLGP